MSLGYNIQNSLSFPQQQDVGSLLQTLAVKELLEFGQGCHLTCDSKSWCQSLFYGLNISTMSTQVCLARPQACYT